MDKIMPVEERVYVSSLDRIIKVSDLSVGYLYMAQETQKDDVLALFEDATDLTEEEALKLRNSEAKKIRDLIIKLTNQGSEDNEGEAGK